ncbi:hypothetical protein KVP10_08605 [Candidimonas humi]|uniref:Phage tail fibre repeat-containing protein n=1 Tax=Candidimonas humi TaxID=683355 RepID=A0ABV8NYR5_9BURK|nr:hypothetical protein [Candidimonas humi]MBV6304947.1 hypothetical protein [Candidimonas humi]
MADHSKPTLTSNYSSEFIPEINGRFADLAQGLDPAHTTPTNLPEYSIRYSSASKRWESWSGTAWAELETEYAINVSTATKLKTARKISISGAATAAGVDFDGSGNIALEVTDLDYSKISNAPTLGTVAPKDVVTGTGDTTSSRITDVAWVNATVGAAAAAASAAAATAQSTADGKVSKSGDTMTGQLTLPRIQANSTTNPSSQGTHIGWNEPSSSGKTRIVNNKGGGVGGFTFDVVDADNTTILGSMALSAAGSVSTSSQGTLWGSSNFNPDSKWSTSDHGVVSSTSNWIRLRWGGGSVIYNIDGVLEQTILSSQNFAGYIATLGAGAVGSYAFVYVPASRNPGDVAAGSDLKWSNAAGNVTGSLSGSWRCMGYAPAGGNTNLSTLWMRYA